MANIIKLSSYFPALLTANCDVVFGSGTPGTLAAPQGSLYVNITASTTTTRLYQQGSPGNVSSWVSYTASA